MTGQPIRLPRGTQDILPDKWPSWRRLVGAAEDTAEAAGFRRIETPTFELTSLFTHATGEHTDVNREMYTFEDRGGDQLSLRPEGTASTVRAYFQHGMQVLPQPVKLYYIGSMFRYERPQSGRLREHHQFGCEAIGSDDALLDASLVDVQRRFYCRASIEDASIHVNSIGDERCRPAYLVRLVAYLKEHESELCGQCRERIERNPLRVLDCKVAGCQPILNAAPKTVDFLCDGCRDHWQRFLTGLSTLGIEAVVDTRLVRGLDYYTRSVWEFLPRDASGATATIGGGGRYDALASAIGAPSTPGVGFSTGLERVLLNAGEEPGPASMVPEVLAIHLGQEAELKCLEIVGELLRRGLRAEMTFGARSLGRQLKLADARHAGLAVIVGEEELARGAATIRDLRSGEQRQVPFDDVAGFVRMQLENG